MYCVSAALLFYFRLNAVALINCPALYKMYTSVLVSKQRTWDNKAILERRFYCKRKYNEHTFEQQLLAKKLYYPYPCTCIYLRECECKGSNLRCIFFKLMINVRLLLTYLEQRLFIIFMIATGFIFYLVSVFQFWYVVVI